MNAEEVINNIRACKTIDQLNEYRTVIVKETKTVNEFKLLQECFVKQKNKLRYKKWIQ